MKLGKLFFSSKFNQSVDLYPTSKCLLKIFTYNFAQFDSYVAPGFILALHKVRATHDALKPNLNVPKSTMRMDFFFTSLCIQGYELINYTLNVESVE